MRGRFSRKTLFTIQQTFVYDRLLLFEAGNFYFFMISTENKTGYFKKFNFKLWALLILLSCGSRTILSSHTLVLSSLSPFTRVTSPLNQKKKGQGKEKKGYTFYPNVIV